MALYRWMEQPWAAKVPSRLAESLNNFESSDNRAPDLTEVIKEARYIIGLHHESGTISSEELSGEHGPAGVAEAEQRIRECEAFIKYGNEVLSATRRSSPAYKIAEAAWLDMLKNVQFQGAEASREINGKVLTFKRSRSRRLQVFLDGARVSRAKAWGAIIPKLGSATI